MAWARLVCLLCLLCLFRTAPSFDVGYHVDLTRDALKYAGFEDTAINIVIEQNMLVDLYSEFPGRNSPRAALMHTDNLKNFTMVQNYWAQLATNTQAAIKLAVKRDDPIEFLTILGITLHAVQDFGTHSSWANIHPRKDCGCYNTRSFVSELKEAIKSGEPMNNRDYVRTGCYGKNEAGCDVTEPGEVLHGDACEGLNKDSAQRPLWEEAYAYGFIQSVEWIAACMMWISDDDFIHVERGTVPGQTTIALSSEYQGFLLNARLYMPPSAADNQRLDSEIRSIRFLFSALQVGSILDGKYKGSGSGNLLALVSSFFNFATEILPNSAFISQFERRIINRLTVDLYSGNPNPNTTALLQILSLQELQDADLVPKEVVALVIRSLDVRLDRRRPSPYSGVVLSGFEYAEAAQRDKNHPQPLFWTTIHFARRTEFLHEVEVQYNLYDSDKSSIDPINLTDRPVTRTRLFNRSIRFGVDLYTEELSGDLSSFHNSTDTAVTVNGADGSVKFFVDVRPVIASCQSSNVDLSDFPHASNREALNGEDDSLALCPETAIAAATPPLCSSDGADLIGKEFTKYLLIFLFSILAGVSISMIVFYRCVASYAKGTFLFSPKYGPFARLVKYAWGVDVGVYRNRQARVIRCRNPHSDLSLIPTILSLPSYGQLKQIQTNGKLGEDDIAVGYNVTNDWFRVYYTCEHDVDDNGGLTEPIETSFRMGWVKGDSTVVTESIIEIYIFPILSNFKFKDWLYWSKPFKTYAILNILEFIFIVCLGFVAIAFAAGPYAECWYGAEDDGSPMCIEKEMIAGVEFSLIPTLLAEVTAVLILISMITPTLWLCGKLLSKTMKTTRRVLIVNHWFGGLVVIILALVLFVVRVVVVLLRGYCQGLSHGCFGCSGETVAECSLRARNLGGGGLNADPDCYYDMDVYNSVCGGGGLYGRAMALFVFLAFVESIKFLALGASAWCYTAPEIDNEAKVVIKHSDRPGAFDKHRSASRNLQVSSNASNPLLSDDQA